MRKTCWLLLVALSACGYTDAGDGSKTLKVEATAEYIVGRGDTTSVEVSVSNADDIPIDTATIQIKDGNNDEAFVVPYEGEGTYRLDIQGYRRKLELNVKADSDGLQAKLEGPGPHQIVEPKPGGTSRSSLGSKLRIEWSTNDGIRADEVRLRIHGQQNLERVVSNDSGSYEGIVLSLLPDPGDYRLHVTRVNNVDLAGGLPGSVFSIQYSVQADFTLLD